MRVRGLIAVCALLVFCGAPLASARTLVLPSDFTVEATSSDGALVTFDDTGYTCTPASPATFSLGPTTVNCTDAGGVGAPPFTVTVVDTTPPVVTPPANESVTTSNPSGTAVTYGAASATDAVAVGSIIPSCLPSSGSNFPVGTTTVTCSASDGFNTGTAAFTVTVTMTPVDNPPSFADVPQGVLVEANGPSGSTVNYTAPTASDDNDGLRPVACTPESGSIFPLGASTVTCTASDTAGHQGQAAFTVTVHDTTPPTLVVPAPHSVYAMSALGITDSDPAVIAFVNAASATDIVDSHPVVGSDLHSFLPVGVTAITFFARDFSGNGTAREVLLTVLPQPPAGTAPLPVPEVAQPPANIGSLSVTPLDGALRLTWQTPAGIDHVVVTRSNSDGSAEEVVYSGNAESYADQGLENGVEYRYVVRSVDAAGNRSAGVAIVAVPLRNMLRSPKDGAHLKKPPRLAWGSEAEADYYNVQLLRNGVRIFTAWPKKTKLTLRKTWTYRGRKYTLTPGRYEWYVWPGFGPRAESNYGILLGGRRFWIRP